MMLWIKIAADRRRADRVTRHPVAGLAVHRAGLYVHEKKLAIPFVVLGTLLSSAAPRSRTTRRFR